MNIFPSKNISSFLWILIFLLLLVALVGAKKMEKIPASLLITVSYGEGKNQESYRSDILSSVENYLQSRECFERITNDPEEETDLILSFIIDKLEFSRTYGSSLGTMMSDQTDPSVRLKQVSNLELYLSMQLKKSKADTVLMQKDIRIRESRQKMTLDEDTYQYVWQSALNSIQDEVEKKICRKHKKIAKSLFRKERLPEK